MPKYSVYPTRRTAISVMSRPEKERLFIYSRTIGTGWYMYTHNAATCTYKSRLYTRPSTRGLQVDTCIHCTRHMSERVYIYKSTYNEHCIYI